VGNDPEVSEDELKDQSQSSESSIASKVIRTGSVASELVKYAKEQALTTADLNFKIIKTETYIKQVKDEKNPDAEENEYRELKAEEFDILKDEALLTDPNFHLRQVYDIEIFHETQPVFPDLDMNISGNKSLTAVYAIVKAGSRIQKQKNILEELTHYFNQRKLRARVLINIWDEEMISSLSQIAAKVEVNDEYIFETDTQILVSKSVGAKATIHDRLTLHFEKKEQLEDEHGRINYKQRGFITAVTKDEVLITYRKAQAGSPGRNCRGEFIEVAEPNESHMPKFDIDADTISMNEDEEKVEYVSTRNGYISFENNIYFVKEELEINEISFGTTGNVNAGMDTDIVIHVKETDAYKDAIGMGVEVEATEVDVDGNVGSDSTVRAQQINIGGQTHQSSKLYAPLISVYLHRGLAKGKKVEVKRLEQGRIEADEVQVEQAAGGEIYGKNVVIDVLHSHVKVYASQSILIRKIKGSENFLTIDQTVVGEGQEAKIALEKEIDEARIDVNLTKKLLAEKEALLEEHKDTIIDIKKRLLTYQKAGAKMPKSFVDKYKEFQELQNQAAMIKRELQLKKDMFETLESRRSDFQGDVLQAKITNLDIWRGHNEVKFHLTYPDVELSMVPSEGMASCTLSLKFNQDKDEYEIISTVS